MRRDAALVFFAALIFFCIGLGARPYLTPSEARYIEIPRQMLATGDWLTPRIDGVPYFEKPPLFYWLQASVMQFSGSGEFAGRFATALLSALTCLVTFATAQFLYGRLSGFAFCPRARHIPARLWFKSRLHARRPGEFFPHLLLCLFPRSAEKPEILSADVCRSGARGDEQGADRHRHPRPGHRYVGRHHAAVADTGRSQIIHRLYDCLCHRGALAPADDARTHPAFFDFYFIHEHFTRYLTDSHKRIEPWWFFIAILPAGLLPWTGLILSS